METQPRPEDALLEYQALREEIAERFPFSEERLAEMRVNLGRTKELLLEHARERPGAIVVGLTRLRDRLLKEEGRVSRPALCTQYIIEEIGRPMIEKTAMQALRRGNNIEEYTLAYDVAYGMVQTAMRVEIGEQSIIEDMDKELEDSAQEIKSEGIAEEDELQDVLKILKDENREAARLLREDKSEIPGSELLQDFVEKIRNGQASPLSPKQIRELVAYGAEITLEFYKAIYPLSGKVPSPHPQK